MNRTGMLVVFAMSVVIGSGVAPAYAQDVTLGYQVQRFSADGESETAGLGFSGDIAVPLQERIGIVGSIDWSRYSDSTTVLGTEVSATSNYTAFAGGLRYSAAPAGSIRPYVQALVGVMRSSFDAEVAGSSFDDGSSTDFMLQLGGGVSVPVSGNLSGVGQVDYRRIFAEDLGVNGLRFLFGVRLSLR